MDVMPYLIMNVATGIALGVLVALYVWAIRLISEKNRTIQHLKQEIADQRTPIELTTSHEDERYYRQTANAPTK